MPVIITDVSVVCCLSVLAVQTKTSKFGIPKQNKPIGTRIPVENLFLTWDHGLKVHWTKGHTTKGP